jgi:polysaccharide biosynthesis protein PslG
VRRRRTQLVVAAGAALAAALAVVLAVVLSGGGGGPPLRLPAPLLPAPAPLARPGPVVYGVSVDRVFNGAPFDAAGVDRQLAAVHAHGIRLARSDALWEAAEPLPPGNGGHAYDWTFADRVAGALASHGIRWWPIVDYAPAWATGIAGEVHAPPASDADYAAFAGAFAARYGQGGTFWAAHPELPRLPVDAYEIWNEENTALFWKPRPDPVRYSRLYLAARAAIREADPAARVVVGGLAPDRAFLGTLLATPGLAGQVDGVALHPYGDSVAEVLDRVRAARSILDSAGASDAPLSITELGWQTNGPNDRDYATEDDRAARLAAVASAVASGELGVDAFVVYTWTVRDPAPGDAYGIYGADGTETPASEAYGRFLRGLAP